MTRLHTIGRRYRSASKYTFARPSEIIGGSPVHAGTEVPSTWYERWNLGKRGTLARVVQDLSPVASILSPLVRRGNATCASHGSGKSGPGKIEHDFSQPFPSHSLFVPFVWTRNNSSRTDVSKAYVLRKQTNDSTLFPSPRYTSTHHLWYTTRNYDRDR